ncbi:type II inositol 3,4-bisphosphate 4-phosphatase isoform X5 [Xiphias gladius]|uniref:type II inositol 3,4-bisphosphate 4-phosphatase isoform X5 n=1 Tax=Xiphias gladius TaxID=8245 RepID=UPI001A9855DB|nr:type II inositol 3,4-bisphosphate 4-phosphatase isoform X5 [Xiphias gladius]
MPFIYGRLQRDQEKGAKKPCSGRKRKEARLESSFLGSATFSVDDLLRAKDERLSLSLRSSDGVCAAGTVVVSRLKMGEMEEVDVDHITTDIPSQKCPLVCESASHACIDRENNPLTGPVFKNPVCKVYRFQTVDSKWMLVREQMEECTLSFGIPKQLLSLYIREDMSRLQELRELGELSPHWDNLRKEVMTRYGGIISSYQETLAELDKITGRSFKPSCCKAQKSLEFIPINLHTQRMRVTCPRKTDAFYDIVTVGAPAAHFQGFKCGGLQRLLSRYEAEKKSFSTAYQCIYYSPEHTAKAQEVLSTMSLLQPLITSLADQLLQAAQEHSSTGLKDALKNLSDKTEQFVHTLKDELVKSALLALHAAQPGYVSKNQKQTPVQADQHQGHILQRSDQNQSPVQGLLGHSPATSVTESTVVCNNVEGSQTTTRGEGGPLPLKHQDSIPHHKEYDEEEWDRVWANVAKCLNCVIAMVDKLQEEESSKQESVPEQQLADVITSHNPGDWREQLCPLVARLKECVMEVVEKAKKAMTFVLLQEAACSIPQGFVLQQRRDVVFSQAVGGNTELAALACGFIMRLYAGMQDKGFLRQLHLVGLVAQFESLLSTYSEEIGMLEDMEVGISDLHRVMFKITEAKTDDLSDLQPLVCGRRDHFTVEVPLPRLVFQTLPEQIKEGKLLQVFPVLFNVGINEQQTIAERFGDISLQERINQKNFEMLEAYYKSLSEKVPVECLPCFQTQTDIKELLETLGQNVVTKKRKNVEILWIAGTICRRLNGIRFTSCKSAKDRTSMSVTLEQCALLRDEHQLSKDFFLRALDCMRSRLTQGDIGQWEDPEAGAVTENKPASRHFYPIALLLVSSHLLVVWLILSLVFLLAKYQ